jgi:putative ABC transport system substrate-binding protein
VNRRDLMILIAGVALVPPLRVVAQEAARVPRISVLMGGTPTIEAERLAAFRESLMRLRYIEGQTIVIEPHYAEGVPDRLGQMAREMVDRKPTAIVCVGGQEARALLEVTRAIPIVFMQSGDAVDQGLVASYARPGGNITGFSQMADELDSKRLELLRGIAPSVSRVAVLTDSRFAKPGRVEKRFAAAEAAAKLLGMVLLRHDATTSAELIDALAAIQASGSEGLLIPNDPLFSTERTRILQFAAARRLPTVFEQKVAVAEGGLVGYGPDLIENARLAAGYIDRILKGAKPADLPVQQPTKFALFINLKTANALGLTVSQSLLQRADEVIE